MRVKTKVILFVLAFFVILGIGIFAGISFTSLGEGSLGVIGTIVAGFALKKRADTSGTTDAADRSAVTARKEASADAESMDRVVQSGEDIQRTGDKLVESGRGLVDESERLIRESDSGASSANK